MLVTPRPSSQTLRPKPSLGEQVLDSVTSEWRFVEPDLGEATGSCKGIYRASFKGIYRASFKGISRGFEV